MHMTMQVTSQVASKDGSWGLAPNADDEWVGCDPP
jgi:hypothetical protein